LKLPYIVVLTPEPDGTAVNVTMPAMPGVLTWGRTTEEALAAAAEAIRLHLEGHIERGRRPPMDRPPRSSLDLETEAAVITVEAPGESDGAGRSPQVA
jgi:antitoxin HicB